MCRMCRLSVRRNEKIKKNVDLPTVYILRAAARAYIDRVKYELTYNITYIL